MSREYHLFISHSWAYSNAYEGVIDLLNRTNLRYRDYSVPKDDPIHTQGSDEALRAAIETKIKPCSCVLILAGVYATYSKWIKEEISIAKKYNKPIIAIEGWGSERTSSVVKENADAIVKWQSSSLKKAIEENVL